MMAQTLDISSLVWVYFSCGIEYTLEGHQMSATNHCLWWRPNQHYIYAFDFATWVESRKEIRKRQK